MLELEQDNYIVFAKSNITGSILPITYTGDVDIAEYLMEYFNAWDDEKEDHKVQTKPVDIISEKTKMVEAPSEKKENKYNSYLPEL